MSIEMFDMDQPFLRDDSRIRDVMSIRALWLQVIEVETDHTNTDAEFLRSMMAGLDYLVLREDKNQAVVGAVSVMDCKRGIAKIESLAVDELFRGRGNGSKLAGAAVQHCSDQGYSTIHTIAMPSSYRIFDKLGFDVDTKYDSGNMHMSIDLRL